MSRDLKKSLRIIIFMWIKYPSIAEYGPVTGKVRRCIWKRDRDGMHRRNREGFLAEIDKYVTGIFMGIMCYSGLAVMAV